MRLALCIRGGIESGPRMGREMDSFETEMEERERLGLGRGRRERRKLGCRGRFLTPEGERGDVGAVCGTASVVASVPPFVASIEGRSDPLTLLQLSSSSSGGVSSSLKVPLIPKGAKGSSVGLIETLVRCVELVERWEEEVGDLEWARREGGEKDEEDRW
jgi:hypothetical protein